MPSAASYRLDITPASIDHAGSSPRVRCTQACGPARSDTARRKDEVVGVQLGQRDVLQQDGVVIVAVEVDLHVMAVRRGRDVILEPGVKALLRVRIEGDIVQLDLVLARRE